MANLEDRSAPYSSAPASRTGAKSHMKCSPHETNRPILRTILSVLLSTPFSQSLCALRALLAFLFASIRPTISDPFFQTLDCYALLGERRSSSVPVGLVLVRTCSGRGIKQLPAPMWLAPTDGRLHHHPCCRRQHHPC